MDTVHCHYDRRYWANKIPHLGTQRSIDGKDVREFRARQCSARGGELRVAVAQDETSVLVTGSAVTILRGKLEIPPEEC